MFVSSRVPIIYLSIQNSQTLVVIVDQTNQYVLLV
jgi:hypothetical protein